MGFLDTFPVNMATPTPENRAKIFLRKQGSIAMMMPAFMPVEKIDMGLHVELTSRNEHMVTTIDPGSPASQEGTMRRTSPGTDSPIETASCIAKSEGTMSAHAEFALCAAHGRYGSG